MKKIAAIQMTSTANIDENLDTAQHYLTAVADAGASVAVLPEMFPLQGMTDTQKFTIAESLGDGKIQRFLSEEAKKHQMWIVGGTIPIQSNNPDKVFASCLVFNDQGQRVAVYNKIHLFDADVSDTEYYRESNTTIAGDKLALVDTPCGRLGLAVCYDIRFPEMFRCMLNQGAEIFILPCAFSVKTGQAHFEVLMRARAIENFSYVVAACQYGKHQNNRLTHGDSMIVSPWGNILERLQSGQGYIIADVDLALLKEIRKSIPAVENQRMRLNEFVLF